MLCTIDGCAEDYRLASGLVSPFAITVDDTHIYSLARGVVDMLDNLGPGSVMRMHLDQNRSQPSQRALLPDQGFEPARRLFSVASISRRRCRQ